MYLLFVCNILLPFIFKYQSVFFMNYFYIIFIYIIIGSGYYFKVGRNGYLLDQFFLVYMGSTIYVYIFILVFTRLFLIYCFKEKIASNTFSIFQIYCNEDCYFCL